MQERKKDDNDNSRSSPIPIPNSATRPKILSPNKATSIDDLASVISQLQHPDASSATTPTEDDSPNQHSFPTPSMLIDAANTRGSRSVGDSQHKSHPSIISTSEGSQFGDYLDHTPELDDDEEYDEASAYATSSDPNWHTFPAFRDVEIHVPSFQAGLTVIRPITATSMYTRESTPTPYENETEASVSKTNAPDKPTPEYAIQIKDRKIYFSKPNSKPNSATLKAINLLSEMESFAHRRCGLYLVSHLDQVTLLNQNDFILFDNGYQQKLYLKNLVTGNLDLLLEGDALKQVLQAINVREVLKKRKPCRLNISSASLDFLERSLPKRSTLYVTTDTTWLDSHNESGPQFVLKISGNNKTILRRKPDGNLSALKVKPENIDHFIKDSLGLTHDFNGEFNASIPLNLYQQEKLEQLASLASRTLFIGTTLSEVNEEKKPADYYLIYKPIQQASLAQSTLENTAEAKNEKVKSKDKKKVSINEQFTFELYYRNANGTLIPLTIESNELSPVVYSFGLEAKIKNHLSTTVLLSYERSEQIEKIIKPHITMTAYNESRNDEIYVAMPEVGLYAQPWLSRELTKKPTTSAVDEKSTLSLSSEMSMPTLHGFKRFYTVGCLFGSTLKGTDLSERRFPLIKHDGIIYRGKLENKDKLKSITFNPEALNPYETMLFNEQRKIIKLIHMYSDRASKAEKPVITYHLPCMDYILFGLSLLAIDSIARDPITNNICYDVLERLFIATFHQKNKHIKIIQNLYNHAGIEVQFESPFDNLLDTKQLDIEFKALTEKMAKREKVPRYALTKTILRMLKLLDVEQSEGKNLTVLFKNEKELTDHLVNLLITENNKPNHKKCWIEFLEAAKKHQASQIDKLETLVNKAKSSFEAFTESNEVTARDQKRLVYKQNLLQLHQMLKPFAVSQFEKIELSKLYTSILNNEATIDDLKTFGLSRLNISTLEDLFKIGNPAMLGIATQYCNNAYDVCAILPTSEKQIQVNYKKLFDYLPETIVTPSQPIVNITFLPTAICADQTNIQNAGLMFYYDSDQSDSIASVINQLRTAADTNLLAHAIKKSKMFDDISSLSIPMETALSSTDTSPQMAGRKSPVENAVPNVSLSPK